VTSDIDDTEDGAPDADTGDETELGGEESASGGTEVTKHP
jgi:hypothetical protein